MCVCLCVCCVVCVVLCVCVCVCVNHLRVLVSQFLSGRIINGSVLQCHGLKSSPSTVKTLNNYSQPCLPYALNSVVYVDQQGKKLLSVVWMFS